MTMLSSLGAKFVLLLLLVANLTGAFSAEVERDGEALLQEFSSKIDELGSYEVTFSLHTVSAEQYVEGSYLVDGDRYRLELSGFEIIGDSSTRYTIDRANQEMVIEPMTSNLPIVVVNPAAAFSSLDRHFSATIIDSESGCSAGSVELELKPLRDDLSIDRVVLKIDVESYLPQSISYTMDGEQQVRLLIDSIRSTELEIPQLDAIELPEGYELIDIR